MVIAIIVALVLLFSIFIQGFATLGNLRVIASNSAALVILSCGMGMVIISRGLDLSLVATMVAGRHGFCDLDGLRLLHGRSHWDWRCWRSP